MDAESLEQRRLKTDLYMYYKIISELVDLPVDEFFCFKQRVTRNNGASIYQNSFRFTQRDIILKSMCVLLKFFSANKVIKSKFLNDFKKYLICIDLSKFLRSNYDSVK